MLLSKSLLESTSLHNLVNIFLVVCSMNTVHYKLRKCDTWENYFAKSSQANGNGGNDDGVSTGKSVDSSTDENDDTQNELMNMNHTQSNDAMRNTQKLAIPFSTTIIINIEMAAKHVDMNTKLSTGKSTAMSHQAIAMQAPVKLLFDFKRLLFIVSIANECVAMRTTAMPNDGSCGPLKT